MMNIRRLATAGLTVVTLLAVTTASVGAQAGAATSAIATWNAAHADFATKGEEIIADFTIIFDTAWMGEWQADLANMDAAAAAMGAAVPTGTAAADALLTSVAGATAAATVAAQAGMDNIAGDSGASLTAAYSALGGIDADVQEASALLQAAGAPPAPADSGNAGLTPEGTSLVLVLMAIGGTAAVLASGRFATARTRS
ncbi:MAG: hypothetical protein WD058_04555 [Dehalococcoidia bacterium]